MIAFGESDLSIDLNKGLSFLIVAAEGLTRASRSALLTERRTTDAGAAVEEETAETTAAGGASAYSTAGLTRKTAAVANEISTGTRGADRGTGTS